MQMNRIAYFSFLPIRETHQLRAGSYVLLELNALRAVEREYIRLAHVSGTKTDMQFMGAARYRERD